MTQYVGLDVSMKETQLHLLDEAGQRIWRGRCTTEPAAIAAAVRWHAPTAVRIGLETGPLTTWLWTELTAEGLPMVCLDARHAKKAPDMKVNKTDRRGGARAFGARRLVSGSPGSWRHAGEGAARRAQSVARHLAGA
jgi:transposase